MDEAGREAHVDRRNTAVEDGRFPGLPRELQVVQAEVVERDGGALHGLEHDHRHGLELEGAHRGALVRPLVERPADGHRLDGPEPRQVAARVVGVPEGAGAPDQYAARGRIAGEPARGSGGRQEVTSQSRLLDAFAVQAAYVREGHRLRHAAPAVGLCLTAGCRAACLRCVQISGRK